MKMKKAARARARDAVAAATAAAAAAPKKLEYTTWKFIFQDKVIKTHQSLRENIANIGNLPQVAKSSNNPNKLHRKGLPSKPHERQAPQTRNAHGMCKLATKSSLHAMQVPCPMRRLTRNCDKKIAPKKSGKLDKGPSQEVIMYPNSKLFVIEAQKNSPGNAHGTVGTTSPVKNFFPPRLASRSQNNDQEKAPRFNELGTSRTNYEWQDPCLQVVSLVRGVENIDEQMKEGHKVCDFEYTTSLVEEPHQSKREVPVDWETFDFNTAPFIRGHNPLISSCETQYESQYESQCKRMPMEIDTFSFFDASVDSYYILPNYEAADDMLILWH